MLSCLLLTNTYIFNFSVNVTITVLYLLGICPIEIYLLVRIPVVRRTLRGESSLFVWIYAGTVLVGGQLFFAGLLLAQAELGEAIQAHALLGMSVGVTLAHW